MTQGRDLPHKFHEMTSVFFLIKDRGFQQAEV